MELRLEDRDGKTRRISIKREKIADISYSGTTATWVGVGLLATSLVCAAAAIGFANKPATPNSAGEGDIGDAMATFGFVLGGVTTGIAGLLTSLIGLGMWNAAEQTAEGTR